jgi:hypothetical protein
VEVRDYHEFDELQDHYRLLNKNIKVKELGCDGNYIGIVYVFNLRDKENKALVDEINAYLKESGV